MADDELLTYDEAAALVKVGRSTVIRWTREGKLPLYKVGRIARVKKADVLNVLTVWQPTHGGLRPGGGRPKKTTST